YFPLRRLNHQSPGTRGINGWATRSTRAAATKSCTSGGGSFRFFQLDLRPIYEDVPDPGFFSEQIAACDNQVSNLPNLDRANLIRGTEHFGGGDRQCPPRFIL